MRSAVVGQGVVAKVGTSDEEGVQSSSSRDRLRIMMDGRLAVFTERSFQFGS